MATNVSNKYFFNQFEHDQTHCDLSEDDRLRQKVAGQVARIEELGNRLELNQSERTKLLQSVSKLQWRERELYFEETVKPIALLFEKINTGVDINSMLRNGLRAILCLPVAANPAVVMSLIAEASQLLGGIAAIIGGGVILARGLANGAKAFDRGDVEGVCKNALFATFGASYATAGVGFTLDAVAGFMKATSATSIWPAAGLVVVYGVIVMSAVQSIDATWGLGITFNFERNLKKRVNDEKEPEESKRLKNALKWVQDQVSLSDSEILKIISQTPNLLDVRKKVAKKLQGKWDQFERRTSRSCGKLVHETLHEVLRSLETGEPDALVKGRSLIEEIKKANYQERVAYTISLVIAVLLFIAGICAIAFLGPAALVPILFAIGAMLWVTLDNGKVNSWVSEVYWAQKQLSSSAQVKARQQVLDDLAAVQRRSNRENNLL
ncbi:MAG: hypothetical protein V4487_08120 [Chlamydiota bacterium]